MLSQEKKKKSFKSFFAKLSSSGHSSLNFNTLSIPQKLAINTPPFENLNGVSSNIGNLYPNKYIKNKNGVMDFDMSHYDDESYVPPLEKLRNNTFDNNNNNNKGCQLGSPHTYSQGNSKTYTNEKLGIFKEYGRPSSSLSFSSTLTRTPGRLVKQVMRFTKPKTKRMANKIFDNRQAADSANNLAAESFVLEKTINEDDLASVSTSILLNIINVRKEKKLNVSDGTRSIVSREGEISQQHSEISNDNMDSDNMDSDNIELQKPKSDRIVPTSKDNKSAESLKSVNSEGSTMELVLPTPQKQRQMVDKEKLQETPKEYRKQVETIDYSKLNLDDHSANETFGTPANYPLYVGELDLSVTEELLASTFGKYSGYISCKIPLEYATKTSMGYGYVNFKDKSSAEVAIESLNYTRLLSSEIRIMPSIRDRVKREQIGVNIILQNLPNFFTTRLLYEKLSTFGKILSCKFYPNFGKAYVLFESPVSAYNSISTINNSTNTLWPEVDNVFAQVHNRERELKKKQIHPDSYYSTSSFLSVSNQSPSKGNSMEISGEFSSPKTNLKLTSNVVTNDMNKENMSFPKLKSEMVPMHYGLDTLQLPDMDNGQISHSTVANKQLNQYNHNSNFPAYLSAKLSIPENQKFDFTIGNSIKNGKQFIVRPTNEKTRASIFIKNLPLSITREAIVDLIKPFGKVLNVRSEVNKTKNAAWALAVVAGIEERDAAIQSLNKITVNGNVIKAIKGVAKGDKIPILKRKDKDHFENYFYQYKLLIGTFSLSRFKDKIEKFLQELNSQKGLIIMSANNVSIEENINHDFGYGIACLTDDKECNQLVLYLQGLGISCYTTKTKCFTQRYLTPEASHYEKVMSPKIVTIFSDATKMEKLIMFSRRVKMDKAKSDYFQLLKLDIQTDVKNVLFKSVSGKQPIPIVAAPIGRRKLRTVVNTQTISLNTREDIVSWIREVLQLIDANYKTFSDAQIYSIVGNLLKAFWFGDEVRLHKYLKYNRIVSSEPNRIICAQLSQSIKYLGICSGECLQNT